MSPLDGMACSLWYRFSLTSLARHRNKRALCEKNRPPVMAWPRRCGVTSWRAPRAKALKQAEAIGPGVARGPGAKKLPRIMVPAGAKDEALSDHPCSWAGFVLVGDPD
jgi:hypothetical protein